MANPRQLKQLKKDVNAWNEWRKENRKVKINLRGANLSGQDLSKANLSEADIQGANFSKAILRDADFSGSKAGLQRRWVFIIFLSSWLITLGLIFVFIKIVIFVFQETILETRAIIELAIIVSAVIFTGIVVVLIVFAQAFARVVTGDFTPAGTFIKFLLFGYIGLLGILVLGQLDQKIITVAEAAEGIFIIIIMLFFVMVIYYLARFILSNFKKDNSIYDWAQYFAIALVRIKDTSFRGADLENAIFSEAILKGADFREADISGVVWLKTKFFERVRPGDSYLKYPQVRQLVSTGSTENQQPFKNKNLRGINLECAILNDTNFAGADLSNANLQDKDKVIEQQNQYINNLFYLIYQSQEKLPQLMAKAKKVNNFYGSVGSVGNKGEQTNISANVQGSQIGIQYTSEQKQILLELAAHIKKILEQFEQNNPDATEEEKIIYLNDNTTPSFKRRVIGALQAAGETAIEEFLDNSYVNIGKATIKAWLKPE